MENIAQPAVDQLQWTLAPQPRAEAVDVLGLDEAETLAYVQELQTDAESLRRTLHETLRALARANAQSDRYQQRVLELLAALRVARADASSLRADLRVCQDRAA